MPIKKIQYLIQGHGWHFNMYNRKTFVNLFRKYEFKEIKIINPGETRIKHTDGLDLYVCPYKFAQNSFPVLR